MNHNDPDLIYQLALTEVPHIGYVHAKLLVEHFGSAENIFKAPASILEKVDGIGEIRAGSIKKFKAFKTAEVELKFLLKYGIEMLFINSPGYPSRLLNIYDPPTLLFYRGVANLNTSRIVSIIGTRSCTDYGRSITEKLVKVLAGHQVTVVSGLAFGVDAQAHKVALKQQLPTIGVLAHGLDSLYPPEHAQLARNMLKTGGLLTEFKSNTKPDKHHFPSRNRIVAGMSDAVIVVETGLKGGSLITANLANGYSRDVFAFPGKITDPRSQGCNMLIKHEKAIILNDPEQFVETMGWNDHLKPKMRLPKELFDSLDEKEQILVNILRESAPMHIDELMIKSGMSSSTAAAVILALELRSIITTLPGKRLNLM